MVGERWRFMREGLTSRFTGDICIDRTTGRCLSRPRRACSSGATDDQPVAPDIHDERIRGSSCSMSHLPKVFFAGTEEDGVWKSDRWRTDLEGAERRTGAPDGLCDRDCAGRAPGRCMLPRTAAGSTGRMMAERAGYRRSQGLTTLDCHAVLVLPSDPRTVFAGTLNGGLFKSTDGGETWRFNSQEDAQVWGISVKQ